jgi:hypothetical protein
MWGWTHNNSWPEAASSSAPSRSQQVAAAATKRAKRNIITETRGSNEGVDGNPQAEGRPPLRRDLPSKKARSRGALPAATTAEERELAMADLKKDVYSSKGWAVTDAKLNAIQTALAQWGFDLWPPTPAKVSALGSMLKLGKYLSAANYLYS